MDNQKRLSVLQQNLASAWSKLELDQKLAQQKQLEVEIARPEIWLQPDHARTVNEQFSRLTSLIEPWQILKAQSEDIKELIDLNEPDLDVEIADQLLAMERELDRLKISLKFTGPFDESPAIIRLTSGAGGIDAMDWTEMLERMYLRFFERTSKSTSNSNAPQNTSKSTSNSNTSQSTSKPVASNSDTAQDSSMIPPLSATLIERQPGEEAGIKTAVYEVKGLNAYGYLKSEHGVHRLVRLSPFNADHLRQTSFALVEVLPLIDNPNTIRLDDKDLRIDVYHSGGHGGQSVNTTKSAVRITHLPTGISVAIQNERSQLQNKEKALELLRSKLAQMQLEQQAESIDKLRAGESASWGQQIRNYILQPYKLVKDTRTKYESTDPDSVLDGKIEGFINAYLEA